MFVHDRDDIVDTHVDFQTVAEVVVQMVDFDTGVALNVLRACEPTKWVFSEGAKRPEAQALCYRLSLQGRLH